MKKFLSIILITVATMAMGVSLASCEKEDYGYYDVEKHLFGEWESDSIQTNERNGIVWYLLQIVPSDKHSVSPYRMIVKRKDGKYYLHRKGTMGHWNSNPNDIMSFYDELNAYGTWNIKIEWLNKEKTRAVLFRDRNDDDIVFHKTKNSTEYEKYWWQD